VSKRRAGAVRFASALLFRIKVNLARNCRHRERPAGARLDLYTAGRQTVSYCFSMRVLGIDCGSMATGYGLVESDGRRHQALDFGVVRAGAREAFAPRLHRIHCRLTELILAHQPDCVAIENVFYAENVRSALKLGHVRGVAMQAAAAQGLTIAEYSPLEVKSALTGYGRAEKHQVQRMVQELLRLAVAPVSLDASDALAVAICHIHYSQGQALAAPGLGR